jgi:hypothetical protein
MDTLCELSREKQPNIAKLYVYAKTTGSLDFFNTNCVTMEQLISSGNLRLMDPEISLNLSKYSKSIHDMDNDNSLIREEYEKISDLKLRIFDGYTLASLSPKLIRNARDSVFNLNLALLDDDPKLMRLFIGWVKVESGYYQGSIGAFLEPLLNKAKELLTLLNKKYHLE